MLHFSYMLTLYSNQFFTHFFIHVGLHRICWRADECIILNRCHHTSQLKHAPRPHQKKETNRQCWYSPLLHSIFKPAGYFNFYWNPWILKEEILKCEFLHQPYACALTSEFSLIYIKCYNCNRRLMTCALTFFLMIFFRNSGKPLLKFSLTNSSLSTSWSFLNPSAQKKKRIKF